MKLQLKTIRLTSKDVISTSACNLTAVTHYLITDIDGNDVYYDIYKYELNEDTGKYIWTWNGLGADDSSNFPKKINIDDMCTRDDSIYSICNNEHEYDCLAVGTKITMADGTIKNIEDIKEGDNVLTFNHELGTYEGQKVSLVWKSKEPKCPFTLKFADGNSISVIGDHNFFEKEELRYVSILEKNAREFIGKHFYNVTKKEYIELVDVVYETVAVDYYEIYSAYNINCIAQNLLNVPYDCHALLNLYKFNEDLTVDHDELNKDIKEFGLLEYSEVAAYSKELFDSFRWKYVKVAIGKGLTTLDECCSGRDSLIELKK